MGQSHSSTEVTWSGGRNGAGKHGNGDEYNPHTKQTRRGRYENDRPVGKWQVIDDKGMLIRLETYDALGNLLSVEDRTQQVSYQAVPSDNM